MRQNFVLIFLKYLPLNLFFAIKILFKGVYLFTNEGCLLNYNHCQIFEKVPIERNLTQIVQKITTFLSSNQSSERRTLLPIQDSTIVCIDSPELLGPVGQAALKILLTCTSNYILLSFFMNHKFCKFIYFLHSDAESYIKTVVVHAVRFLLLLPQIP